MNNDWFGFTLQERRGIAVFIILCSVIYGIGAFWPQKEFKEKDLSKYFNTSDSIFVDEDESYQNFNEVMWAEEKSKKICKFQLFIYNLLAYFQSTFTFIYSPL